MATPAGDSGAFGTDQIVVAVRARPLNTREKSATAGRDLIVRMQGKQTDLLGNIARLRRKNKKKKRRRRRWIEEEEKIRRTKL